MSFKVALNKIYMTKGDTARFTISLTNTSDNNNSYELSEKDDIYFILTETPDIIPLEDLDNNPSCIFYKKGTSIKLDPEDTMNLREGEYYYQVRVVLGESGDLNTIIEPEDFYLTPKEW